LIPVDCGGFRLIAVFRQTASRGQPARQSLRTSQQNRPCTPYLLYHFVHVNGSVRRGGSLPRRSFFVARFHYFYITHYNITHYPIITTHTNASKSNKYCSNIKYQFTNGLFTKYKKIFTQIKQQLIPKRKHKHSHSIKYLT